MTKHLRLIMLSLFAMICMGGYSAVGDTYKLVTSVAELNDGDVIVIGASQQGYAMGPVNSTNSNNRLGKKVDIVDGVLKFADGVAELTLKACTDNKWQFHSNEGYLYAAGANKDKQNYLRSDEAITGEQSIATIAFEGNNATITFGGNAKSKVIKHNYSKNKKTGVITSYFSCYSSNQTAIQIYKKQSVDNRQDAGISFATNSYTADINGGTFNDAKLDNLNGLEVTYEIAPKSEGVSIAVDGTVTYPAVEAKYTVTAKFAGNDTYKPATATYTLNVVDPNAVVFDATVDKGAYSSGGQYEKIVKADQYTTTLYGSNAAFNATGKAYRFYNGSHMEISVTKGIITKIKIEGNSQDYPLGNLKLRPEQPGKITSSSDNEVIWEGSANSVRFFNSTSKQFRVSKITVTVKPHYTLDETVDNVIEAAENVNVTLKRTFYKDGGWNTLCLPFAVADAKTAFDGAELREVDTEKSNGNTIVFKEVTAIEAGKPYLIKWANSSSAAVNVEKKFEGVTLVAAATPVEVNNGGISFNGFYKMTEASELGASVAAIGAGNKLFKVTEGKMKGFRAAFVLSSGAEATKFNVVIDGTATGIEDLVIDGVKANGRVYNLNGQYVGNSLNGLQPGLYIQNGKKIVVK